MTYYHISVPKHISHISFLVNDRVFRQVEIENICFINETRILWRRLLKSVV